MVRQTPDSVPVCMEGLRLMPRFIRGAPAPETVAEVLECCSADELKGLASLFASHKPTRKADLAALVRQRLESDQSVRQFWDLLDATQRAAVSEAVHSPSGEFDAFRFSAKYGKEPNWGAGDSYGYRRTPSLLCLFLHRRGYDGPHKVPRDLRERLRAFVPAPPPVAIRTLDALPESHTLSRKVWDDKAKKTVTVSEAVPITRYDSERAAAHDLAAVLRLIDAGKLSASEKTGRASGASVQAIAAVLYGGDFYPYGKPPGRPYAQEIGPIRAFAWPLLVQDARLAKVSGSRLQLTPAGRSALASPPHEVLRDIWDEWIEGDFLDEFSRVDDIKGQTGKGARGFTHVEERRAAIVEALRACPPGRWIAFDELSRFTIASGNAFHVHENPWSLYLTESRYGSLGYAGCGGWNILQERYMLAFLFEYAATLGLLDLGYVPPSGVRRDFHENWGTDEMDFLSRYDGLLYLRINPLGAWCLDLAEQYVPAAPEASHALKVLPNLDVVAREPLPAADVLFLDQFAERQSESVWRLDRRRLLRVLEDGGSAGDVEAFLAAKSGGELPQTAAVFLRDAARQATRLSDLGPARLIEAEDAALAQLLANDSRLRPLCRLAGERHLVVPAASEGAFRRTLRELGYALKTTGESPRPRHKKKPGT